MSHDTGVPDTHQWPGEWTEHAACAGADLNLFFGPDLLVAKRICRTCPVRPDCESWIMDVERGRHVSMRAGVYGGLTRHERATLDPQAASPKRQPAVTPKPVVDRTARRDRSETKLSDCPSGAAYRRHVSRGEPIDDACRAAYNAERREERKTAQEARVYALWSKGLPDPDIAREMGTGLTIVRRTRARLGLLPHEQPQKRGVS
ncbi:WhiB family transcriptional regulator [Streptomyces sp. NPDC088182]|uniref:WhiB family transcriptional regulator n=1 Tax=Streptomyces sp. NPDC088182 TaxID=3365838 RepID=UPI00382F7373